MNKELINEKYKLHINYKDNQILRESFHQLTRNTYGFDLEDWYQSGHWTDKYSPYSLSDGEKIIANISVHFMNFKWKGRTKKFLQLGTVMTDEAYRGQGLSRFLMEYILEHWRDKADGIYLFANDSVLNFYTKFGFQHSKEYQYGTAALNRSDKNDKNKGIQKVNMNLPENEVKLFEYASNSVSTAELSMEDNAELIMFYAKGFMKEQVYYIEELDIFIIGEVMEDTFCLNHVITKKSIDLNEILPYLISDEVNLVRFGFTPKNKQVYKKILLNDSDTTLFILGKELDIIESEFCMFPILSHG